MDTTTDPSTVNSDFSITDDQSIQEPISITLKFPPESLNQPFTFPPSSTFADLLTLLSSTFPSYDWTKSKALIEKKPPLPPPPSSSSNPLPTASPQLKKSMLLPGPDSSLTLSALNSATLRLLAPSIKSLSDLNSANETAKIREARRHNNRTAAAPSLYSRPPSQSQSLASSQFTFHLLRPLRAPHLPDPQTALSLLQRLKSDPGVSALMARHKLSVGLLTEMDPLQNTSASHEGVTRLLGLNRNKGEAIELRLRTDDYAGFRNYKDIRRTLCHELAHNTYSEHDRNFWDLTRRYEREVEKVSDTGRTLEDETVSYYAPERAGYGQDDDDVCDHGGWTGGEYVLGGGGGGGDGDGVGGGGGGGGGGGLTSREIRARAAEERMRKAREDADHRRGE